MGGFLVVGRNRVQLATVVVVSLLALAWLPSTLLSDVRGLRANLKLSSSQAADARGPAVTAGTNLALVHAAKSRIPELVPFAIVRAGRWGTDEKPNRKVAFIWQSGQSWTQFALAPRIQVDPSEAAWILIRDASPAEAGFPHPARAWRFGRDWLVQARP